MKTIIPKALLIGVISAAMFTGGAVYAQEDTSSATNPGGSSTISKERLQQLLIQIRAKKEGQNSTNEKYAPKARAGLKSLNGDCIQDLVAQRDEVVYNAFQTFTTDMLTALDARRTAVFDAWGLDDATERGSALKEAWSDWKDAKSAAHRALKSERKSAWENYRTDARAECKVAVPKEEVLESDTAGSIAL